MRRRSCSQGSRARRALAGLLLLTAPVWVLAVRALVPDVLGLRAAAPDVLVAAVVAAAWTRGPMAGALFAALSGCLLDAASGLPFGLVGARLAVLAAVVGGLRDELALEVPGGRLLLLAGAAFAERLLAAVTLEACAPEVSFGPLLERAWRMSLATTALGPVAFAVAGLLSDEAEGAAS